jgi:hypothetical protein
VREHRAASGRRDKGSGARVVHSSLFQLHRALDVGHGISPTARYRGNKEISCPPGDWMSFTRQMKVG